jgi:hypothetical protein
MLLQKLAMPLPGLKTTIVLPAFTRSLPADGNIFMLIEEDVSLSLPMTSIYVNEV